MRLIKTALLSGMIALWFSATSPAAPPELHVVTEMFPPYNYTLNGRIQLHTEYQWTPVTGCSHRDAGMVPGKYITRLNLGAFGYKEKNVTPCLIY